MGFPQFNFAGITQGISRALSGFMDFRFDMPGFSGMQVPIWPIVIVGAILILAAQFRKTR